MGIEKQGVMLLSKRTKPFPGAIIHGYIVCSCIILLVICPALGQVNNKAPTAIHGSPNEIDTGINDAGNSKALQLSDLLKIHVVENKVFLELGIELLSRPILFVRHDKGYKQVVWNRYLDHIRLEAPRIESLSGAIIPLDNDPQVQKNIVGWYPIIKEKSTSKTYYIDATELFTTNPVEWYDGFKEPVVPELTLIQRVGHLKNEMIVETERSISKDNIKRVLPVTFSFFMLTVPMRPRLFDYRMGYFAEDELSSINVSQKNAKACIMRWCLEKQNPTKKLSKPIKPITFYLGTGIPNKWRPYVKAGILEWLPAFEAAGFKDAIEVKDAPSNDGNWMMNSVGHSMVRWSTNENIRGFEKGGGSHVSHIVDLRSGEILNCDIDIASSYQYLADNYFVRCAPLDKRARQYPFPDDLMGELIQSLVAHEAGHAFGIKDAHYGEYAYPFDKMRNEDWLRNMGHTPSIMSYARHNYIMQPEDSMPPSLLIQKVGPMDRYTIAWGYRPFPNIEQPKDELPYLETMIRMQDSVPWYRYNISKREIMGPGQSDDVVDNNDPVKSTELGLKNLRRVLALLPTVTKNEKDNTLRARLYDKTLEMCFEEMEHVLTLVGGYKVFYKAAYQKGESYTKIPLKAQETALDFLVTNAFNVPDWLSAWELTNTFQYSSSTNKMMSFQLKLLTDILEPSRIKRLERMESSSEYHGITKQMVSKLGTGLWSELSKKNINIKPDRQELQSAYITFLTEAISEPKPSKPVNPRNTFYGYSNYAKNVFLSELISLKKRIGTNIDRVTDSVTYAHLRRSLKQIGTIL